MVDEDLSPLNLRNIFQTISMTFLSSSDIFPRLVAKFLKVLGVGWSEIQPGNNGNPSPNPVRELQIQDPSPLLWRLPERVFGGCKVAQDTWKRFSASK